MCGGVELGTPSTPPSAINSINEVEGEKVWSDKTTEKKPVMATSASLFAPTGLSLRGRVIDRRIGKGRRPHSIMAQQQQEQLEQEQERQQENQATLPEQQRQQQQPKGQPEMESLPRQPMAKPKNMSREYGGQWLSSVTRHVRIYAAYIDPITHAFDQTQMDKLTLILDPSNEFVWTKETCQKVYAYFQELVDHYEVIN
ncbi:hypothetical protein COCNU_07G006260 [Cocos nucifera]|uniref:NAD(P)H-quinone oxidoreductase subunit M, chloroplastic n=1 Tax=Cocos nucifera TaxID=13894 RepID=A0A8K0N5A1_COCNU|nr:hypothetical protein COCNU_07G006260 [Cocos nucifera]